MIPSLSVVIVSYRSREPLVACLESLADCRAGLPLEVIVVDNASGDGTADWLRSACPWVETIASPVNGGFTRGVNLGVGRARAETVLVLNPDCVVTPEALARLMHELEADPSLAAVAPALDDGRGHLARSCGRFPTLWTLFCDHLGLAQRFPGSPTFGGYKYGGRAMESLARVDWASGAALMVPRARWDAIGGLDEQIFMYMEEVDWCRRAARAGHGVRFVPDARIIHVGQQSSRLVPGETYLHNLRSRVYYFRKHHGVLAAGLAKGILCASLVCKWAATAARAAGDPAARVYAAGIEAVWAA
jgi:N-acetylglucosaminyl-diphospho-decaprenol L-rhamnosyltransferase